MTLPWRFLFPMFILDMGKKTMTGLLAATLLLGGFTIGHVEERSAPFYFQDRPGMLPEIQIIGTEVPEGGFKDSRSLELWLRGTIWQGGGGGANLRLVLLPGGKAEFTWSNPASWNATGRNRCKLTHQRSHWSCDLVFDEGYQTLRYVNGKRSNGESFSWGEAKLVGRTN